MTKVPWAQVCLLSECGHGLMERLSTETALARHSQECLWEVGPTPGLKNTQTPKAKDSHLQGPGGKWTR